MKTVVNSLESPLWRIAGRGWSRAFAQDDRRARIDVDSYTIDAQINPETQTLTARAAVRFVPLDDQTNSVTFELNNALNISRIVDDKGQSAAILAEPVRQHCARDLPRRLAAKVSRRHDFQLRRPAHRQRRIARSMASSSPPSSTITRFCSIPRAGSRSAAIPRTASPRRSMSLFRRATLLSAAASIRSL